MDVKHDPYGVLGLPRGVTPEEIREAYLCRVREYPPDREPAKFREIHDAYKLLNDPMIQAAAWLDLRTKPSLTDVIDAAENQRPRLPKLFLLALGNQEEPTR
jgi:hypothetical protein